MREILPVGKLLSGIHPMAESVEAGNALTIAEQKLLVETCQSLIYHVWTLQREMASLITQVNSIRTGYDLH